MKKRNNSNTDETLFPMRLSKYLAQAGVASRRKAEDLIARGLVKVNGEVILEQGSKVLEEDQVLFNARKVQINLNKCYVMMNKPAGFVCTASDPFAEKTIFDLINIPGKRLFSIGRLDADSEGLLLLTDDGDFAEKLMHPRFGVKKRYLVVTSVPLPKDAEKKILKGVYSDGEVLRVESVTKLKRKCEYIFVLKEGKKREIRRIIASFGGKVKLLRRLSIGSLALGSLPKGSWKYISQDKLKSFFPDHL